MRLAPHPELLHDPGRRDVAAVAACHDAVQPERIEAEPQHGRAGLAREPAAVMRRVQPEADLALAVLAAGPENGRASCRGRVCPYVSIAVVAVSLKNKTD